MISLDQLCSPAVALEWHEAVAATAALAGLVADSGSTTCPDPAAVFLLPSGELHTSGSPQMPGGAARGLVAVLARLLDRTPCPAELRQTVKQLGEDADSVEGDPAAVVRLMSQLVFFERPDRAAVLAALASRAESALERDRHDTALAVLTDRMAAARATQHADRSRPTTPLGPVASINHQSGLVASPVVLEAEAVAPPRRPPIVPVVVALTVFLGMAYAVSWWFDPAPPAALVGGGQSDEEEAPAARAMEAVPSERASSASRRRPAPSRTAAAAASDPPAPAPVPGSSPAGGEAAPVPAPAPGSTPTSGRVDVVVAEGAGRVLPSTVPSNLDRRIPKGSLYTAADKSVRPPILIRPTLSDRPSPDLPDEQVGTLEFIVNESGTVEHVRLISPANRYQHRMLVAAAKTWQFQPATRDGRPVRFQTRIRLLL